MRTYAYEIVVGSKLDETGVEIRKAARIAFAEGLLEKPDERDLLVKHAADILSANALGSEVTVNVVPFCG